MAKTAMNMTTMARMRRLVFMRGDFHGPTPPARLQKSCTTKSARTPSELPRSHRGEGVVLGAGLPPHPGLLPQGGYVFSERLRRFAFTSICFAKRRVT